MFSALGYSLEKTDYGISGRKRVTRRYTIELHISVDKVIDWSTGETYFLPEDIFQSSRQIQVKGSIEEKMRNTRIRRMRTHRRHAHHETINRKTKRPL